MPATFNRGVKVGTSVQHYKHSQCPVCAKHFEARSDDQHWPENSPKWKIAFLAQGWKCLKGAYGREIFVCSDKCATAAINNW